MPNVTLNPTLNTYLQAAQGAADDKSLVASGAEVGTRGRVGSFFTSSATHRASMDGFVAALRTEYGGAAGQTANAMLAVTREQGKPLTAYMVRQLTQVARQEALRNFLDNPLETRGLNQALDQHCAAGGSLDPAAKALLRSHTEELLRADRGGEGNSAEGLYELVQRGGLPGQSDLVALLRGNDERLGQLPGSLEDKARLLTLTALPRELGRAEPADSFLLSTLAHALPRMRASQPEGALTPATVWQAAFNESLPPGLADNPQALSRALADKGQAVRASLEAGAQARNPNVPSVAASVESSVAIVSPETLAAGQRGQDIRVAAPAVPAQTLDARLNTRLADQSTDSLFARMLGENYGMSSRRYAGSPLTITVGRPGKENLALNLTGQAWPGAVANDWAAAIAGRGEGHALAEGAEGPLTLQDTRRPGMKALAEELRTAIGELGGPGGPSEPQLRSLFNCMGQNGNFVLRKLEHALGLDRTGQNFAYALSLSPGADGAIDLRISSTAPRDELNPERAHLTLSVKPDGSVSGSDLLVRALEEPNDYAVGGRAGRVDLAKTLVRNEGLLTPERLLADMGARAQTLSLGVSIQPKVLVGLGSLADRISKKISAEASAAAAPLTLEQIQARRAAEIGAFFDRIETAAAQVPENRRPAFVRACLESGVAPKPELAQAVAQLSGSSMYLAREIVAAKSSAGVREALGTLNELTSGVWAGLQALTSALPPERRLGAEEHRDLVKLALLMNFDAMLGAAGPESLARGLTRPGGPLRDALYDCREAELGSPAFHQLQMAHNLRSALADRLPEAEAQSLTEALNPDNIRERDLSIARQRDLFGPEAFEVRGASLAANARQMGIDLPATVGASLIQAQPTMEAHVVAVTTVDLREGPSDDREAGLTPALSLSTQFSKDFRRGGVYVDGHYYSPTLPPPGTEPSEEYFKPYEDAFIALFPNPRAAKLISNLLAQNLPGFALEAQIHVTPAVTQAFMAIQTDPALADKARGSIIQDFRVDTLDATAGRYRISSQMQKIAAPDADVDRFMLEIALDVTLGDPPTVDSAKIDFLLRGQEPGPGERS
jgi:hypothetical protein